MKAIILERRGELAAVLCEDGTFANRRVSGEIGETVELAAETVAFPTKKRSRWARSAVAAALALVVTGGTLGYMSGTASAYVSLDVEDSSIELTVNHFGRVIAVNAVSEDAKELAASLSGEVRNRRVEDALDHTMKRLSDDGYFKEDSTAVVAGIATDNEKRAAELRQFVEHSAERVGEKPAYVSESSRAEREQAKEQHVSVGRFGFERDHKDATMPVQPKLETDHDEGGEPTAPAIPANGTEHSAPGESPVPTQAAEPAQGDTQTGSEQSLPPQSSEQPDAEQPQPTQSSGQPGGEQPQPPQGGEQPAPEQDQPPRDEEPDDDREQPPRDEEPDDDREQSPQGEEHDDDREQPPRDEEPDDDHGQPPRGEEPDDDYGQPPRGEEPDDDLDQPPQGGDREDDHGQPPQGGERP